VAVLIVFAACGGVVYLALDYGDRHAARLDREIATHLPPGTPRAEVEEWLKRRGFEPHKIVDEKGRFTGVWANAYKEYFWCNGYLVLSIHFDENGRVTRHGTGWDSNSF
jgi:hypothetical protein